MESLKLVVKVFKEKNDLNALTLRPSWGDSIAKVWPETKGLSHIFAVTPFIYVRAMSVCLSASPTSGPIVPKLATHTFMIALKVPLDVLRAVKFGWDWCNGGAVQW